MITKLKKLILIFVVSILFISCVSTRTIKDTNLNFEVSKNTNVVIELNANATTGYMWKFIVEQDKDVIEFVEDSYVVQNKKLVGTPGIYKYKIKTVSKGKAILKGYYYRPWEHSSLNEIAPNTVYEITVK